MRDLLHLDIVARASAFAALQPPFVETRSQALAHGSTASVDRPHPAHERCTPAAWSRAPPNERRRHATSHAPHDLPASPGAPTHRPIEPRAHMPVL